jgi:hypothetical protein
VIGFKVDARLLKFEIPSPGGIIRDYFKIHAIDLSEIVFPKYIDYHILCETSSDAGDIETGG